MTTELVLSIVIPTRDNARTLRRCIETAWRSGRVSEVIVVDNGSTDETVQIARESGAHVITAGLERSGQRNAGLSLVRSPSVVFLDSDMIVECGALDEADDALDAGADAVILTEASVGTGYWAHVRQLERSCYIGDDDLEACRAFRTTFVKDLGGFSEELSAFEDWDLTDRARRATARIVRTRSRLLHDEGNLTLRRAIAKKTAYAVWEGQYRSRESAAAARRLSPIRRLRPFVRGAGRLVRRPHLAVGVVLLKSLEYAASRRARP